MNIVDTLTGVYELNAIPDITLQRDSTTPSVECILTCNSLPVDSHDYTFNETGMIYIDSLSDTIRAYFIANPSLYIAGTTYNFNVRLVNDSGTFNIPFSVHYTSAPVIYTSAFMTVLQEPNASGFYFQNSIPDIIIQKTDIDLPVTFQLWFGSALVLTEEYVYDVDGIIQIRRLGEIIANYFNSNQGVLAENLLTLITPGLANCLVTYTITEGTDVHNGIFTAIKCDADMTVDAGTWLPQNFLTRACREKRTAKGWNEYLSFYKLNSYGDVAINYKLTYLLNGVITEVTGVLDTILLSTASQVVTFNTSIGRIIKAAALSLDTVVLQYNIWLTGTGLITNIYTFLVDNAPYRDQTQFVYQNCFGVLETFTATGKLLNKKTNEFNLANIDNHYRKITQDFVSEKTCNSGYLSETEMEWIDDLIKSYTVGLYTPQDGMTEEITLVGVDKTDITANELQGFTFGYRRAKNNHLVFANAAHKIFDSTFDASFN